MPRKYSRDVFRLKLCASLGDWSELAHSCVGIANRDGGGTTCYVRLPATEGDAAEVAVVP